MFFFLQSIFNCTWRSNDKLRCLVNSNRLFNSESSPLFTCKTPRSDNYQNMRWKKFSKAIQNRKLILCTSSLKHFCALTMLWKVFFPGWWSWYTRLCAWTEHWDFSAHQVHIITVRWMVIQTCLVQQPLLRFRFRFRDIWCKFNKFKTCRCFVLLHDPSN